MKTVLRRTEGVDVQNKNEGKIVGTAKVKRKSKTESRVYWVTREVGETKGDPKWGGSS